MHVYIDNKMSKIIEKNITVNQKCNYEGKKRYKNPIFPQFLTIRQKNIYISSKQG